MSLGWNGSLSLYGVNTNNVGACGAIATAARIAYVLDSVFANAATCGPGDLGVIPTLSQSYTISYTDVGQMEVDKIIDNLMIDHSTGPLASVQTSNLKNITISNTTFYNDHVTGFDAAWQGTSGNMRVINSKFGQFSIGPFGPGSTTLSDNSLFLDHLTASTTQAYGATELISSMSYNSGTGIMTIPVASVGAWFQIAVPGQKVALGETGLIGTPVQAFTFTGITSDMTNLYVQTDLVGSFPTATCGGSACTRIVVYPAPKNGITQVNNGPGTPDYTQYAAPN
jgi:hypothetical protein